MADVSAGVAWVTSASLDDLVADDCSRVRDLMAAIRTTPPQGQSLDRVLQAAGRVIDAVARQPRALERPTVVKLVYPVFLLLDEVQGWGGLRASAELARLHPAIGDEGSLLALLPPSLTELNDTSPEAREHPVDAEAAASVVRTLTAGVLPEGVSGDEISAAVAEWTTQIDLSEPSFVVCSIETALEHSTPLCAEFIAAVGLSEEFWESEPAGKFVAQLDAPFDPDRLGAAAAAFLNTGLLDHRGSMFLRHPGAMAARSHQRDLWSEYVDSIVELGRRLQLTLVHLMALVESEMVRKQAPRRKVVDMVLAAMERLEDSISTELQGSARSELPAPDEPAGNTEGTRFESERELVDALLKGEVPDAGAAATLPGLAAALGEWVDRRTGPGGSVDAWVVQMAELRGVHLPTDYAEQLGGAGEFWGSPAGQELIGMRARPFMAERLGPFAAAFLNGPLQSWRPALFLDDDVPVIRRVAEDYTVERSVFDRELAERLIMTVAHGVAAGRLELPDKGRLTKKPLAHIHQALVAVLAALGMEPIGAVGEQVPFRLDLHESADALSEGDLCVVTRPGLQDVLDKTHLEQARFASATAEGRTALTRNRLAVRLHAEVRAVRATGDSEKEEGTPQNG